MKFVHKSPREEKRKPKEQELSEIGEAVGVSAVRFNIIRVSPEKGINFRWEEALSFESDSAPFIMYSHARACSITRRVKDEVYDSNSLISEVKDWSNLNDSASMSIEDDAEKPTIVFTKDDENLVSIVALSKEIQKTQNFKKPLLVETLRG